MKNRHYYIDWIRIFLIFSVFLFHVGMIFNNWPFHIKNDIRLDSLTPIMHYLHAWRMPLLFLVSGAGTRFALGMRTNGQYAAERTRRLFIPLLAGIMILVPVQVYIEKINQYPSLFNFYLHFFDGVYPKGNFSWHHLWYLVYLFFISMVFIPFITFFRSAKYAAFERGVEKLASFRGGLLLPFLLLIGSQWLLKPYFPHQTNDFINDWAFICLYFLYFLFGFVLLGNAKVVDCIVRDRYLWLFITLTAAIIMFSIMYVFYSLPRVWILYDILALLQGWTIGLTFLAFAKKYVNVDSAWRKQLNQAIYPIYLLHQPILIVMAYFVIQLHVSILLKALLITLSTLCIVWAVYRFLILPFNAARVIFGLKKKDKKEMEMIPVSEPVAV